MHTERNILIPGWYNVFTSAVFWILLVLLLLIIALAVCACCYARNWRTRKELELLGYPSATAHNSTLSTVTRGSGGNVGKVREVREVPDEVDKYSNNNNNSNSADHVQTEVVRVHTHHVATHGRRNNAYHRNEEEDFGPSEEVDRRYRRY